MALANPNKKGCTEIKNNGLKIKKQDMFFYFEAVIFYFGTAFFIWVCVSIINN